MTAADLDVLSETNVADPYEFFTHMRHEHPVHWSDRYRAWFLYRYHDVFEALRHPAYSSDRVMPIYRDHLSPEQQALRKPTFDVLQHWMVFLDPPDHTRLRQLVMPAFTPKAIGAMRPQVDSVVREAVAAIRDVEEFDLVRDLAYPIPAVVIAEIMGVPREERDLFKKWSDQILVLIFGSKSTADRSTRAQQGLADLVDYLKELIALRRNQPREDLISALIASDKADPPLTDDELVATCALLIFGGHETTTNLIANGTKALLENPDQWDRLRQDGSLLSATVEELLRYDGPSKMIMRRLVDDVEVAGTTMRAGDSVYLVQGSANRDEAVFEAPARLMIDRKPNRHVAFGFGLHHCLGNFLARIEGLSVFETITHELPHLKPVPGSDTWIPALINRGMHSYRVTQ